MSHNGPIVLTGAQIPLYQAAIIKAALTLYAKTGIQANRAYTPTAMLRTAGRITGKKYAPRAYDLAAADLQEWINERAAA